MRILSILLAVFMSIVTLHAHAWSLWEINGAKMDIDGKDIRVASVNTVGGDHIFHSNDKEFENGVYVVATLNASSSTILPRSTALIRDYLRSRGFNATDTPDGCALGIRFEVYDLSIDSSPTILNPQSNGQAKEGLDQAAIVSNEIEATKLAIRLGGNFTNGLANGISVQGHYEGDELKLFSESVIDPTDEKLLVNMNTHVRDTNGVTARTAKKKTDPKTTTADLLTLMTKAWADRYFVKD